MEKLKRTSETISADEVNEELRDDPVLLDLFRQFPTQLWGRHFETIEKIAQHTDSENARQLQIEYLSGIVLAREDAIVEFESKDPFFRDPIFSEGGSADRFHKQLQDLLVSEDRTIGSGQTARVKSLQLEGLQEPVAVKYLLTPTAKTLSVEGEHDMLHEVEIVTTVEKNEQEVGVGKYLRVPHPYFYYKRGPLQCYGMTEIRGINIESLLSGTYEPQRDAVIAALQRKYASRDERAALEAEVSPFMEAVHKVCLHGDIKPKNVMIDTDGVFYLIDFGQSVSANDETEKASEQFANLREHEPAVMRECIRGAFHHIDQLRADVAA